jgi:hypothetical protein
MADIILFWAPEFREIQKEWKACKNENEVQDKVDYLREAALSDKCRRLCGPEWHLISDLVPETRLVLQSIIHNTISGRLQ